MCSAPQNTLMLTAKTPISENSATFLKLVFLEHPVAKYSYLEIDNPYKNMFIHFEFGFCIYTTLTKVGVEIHHLHVARQKVSTQISVEIKIDV